MAFDERQKLEGCLLHDVGGIEPAQFLEVELGLHVSHLAEVEHPDRLVEGHDLVLLARVPTQEDQVIDQRAGEIAFLPVFLDRDPAVPLAELGAVLAEDKRHVPETGRDDPEGLVEEDLLRGIGDVVVPAQDMGDAQLGIVDDAGEVIGRRAV